MRLLIVLSFLLVASGPAVAQFPADVQRGTRVRVWIPEAERQEEGPNRTQRLRGTVESVDAGMLRLRIPEIAGTLAIPRAQVRRLDVTRGVSRAESMVERAFGGALVGAIVFGTTNDPRNSSGPNFRTDWEAAGFGAAWGAGIGAVVGLIWPYERWRRVIR